MGDDAERDEVEMVLMNLYEDFIIRIPKLLIWRDDYVTPWTGFSSMNAKLLYIPHLNKWLDFLNSIDTFLKQSEDLNSHANDKTLLLIHYHQTYGKNLGTGLERNPKEKFQQIQEILLSFPNVFEVINAINCKRKSAAIPPVLQPAPSPSPGQIPL
ncbi:unnamed protein product, partial [Mesorhabditis belari]|uniref:Uncharacterized protein n=1 Tax=Mesorhabditis belari TaxID=2138241 RepID=A0AAF3FB48_9BILA